ncbi:hypothetical protein Q7C36_005610 [Tachysurus vachellii]|uniref:Coiled-coil domain-containing protein 122 n=1 Tax=Tachysurus vachellii TaxID=175792 RepID=A0AA88NF77_TACVA|nr:coiled-coil domain-containing protein 122 isoform X1 [Tachysurus vachellii]KAK2857691.1 hypothetical protein Q7C36_005610 [Tachysurus vachellii]
MSYKKNSFSEQFTLCSALLQATQQGESQAAELKEKQQILNSAQDTLSKIVKSYATVSSNIKLKVQQITGITNEMEHVNRQIERQQTEIQVIQMENRAFCCSIEEQLENSHSLLAWYNNCHNKMKSYKMSLATLESQTTIHMELMEKREKVKRQKEHIHELKMDLQNPEGNAIQQAQKEIVIIKAQIHKTKELVRRKATILENEKKNHSQLRRDIAIHNRRCEAIIKWLCCQLNKSQSTNRELSSEIFHMEKEVKHLKKQLGTLNNVG